MAPNPTSIALGFPHARYYPGYELITWHPRGVLDDELLDQVAAFTQVQEHDVAAPTSLRFTDFSQLTSIRLQLGHVFKFAEERSEARREFAPVKSAFFCDKVVGFGMARMYESLMEGSSIHVRAFRELTAAAEWLCVPVNILTEDDSANS